MNPSNREASADRRALLLAAFDVLPEDDRADLLEAVETLAATAKGVDAARDEARAVLARMYTLAGLGS
jgi:hypothetical protein